MEASRTCALCGDPIQPGQAWMESAREGAVLTVHSGCLYREGQAGDGGWEPQERAAE